MKFPNNSANVVFNCMCAVKDCMHGIKKKITINQPTNQKPAGFIFFCIFVGVVLSVGVGNWRNVV